MPHLEFLEYYHSVSAHSYSDTLDLTVDGCLQNSRSDGLVFIGQKSYLTSSVALCPIIDSYKFNRFEIQ